MSRAPEDGGFLGRWSRLKREGEPLPEAAPAEPAPDAVAAPEPEQTPEKTDDEILEELGLPEPESLSKGDDFSAFMAKAVPDRIRRRALRRLWLSDPVLANLDEMVDYGEDFTDAATVVANLTTAYKVGRGFLKDPDEEADAEAEAGDEPDKDADTEVSADAGDAPAPEEATPEDAAPAALSEAEPESLTLAAAPPPPEPDPAPIPRPRRMRFVSGAADRQSFSKG